MRPEVTQMRSAATSVILPLLNEHRKCNRQPQIRKSCGRRRTRCRPIAIRIAGRAHCLQRVHDGSPIPCMMRQIMALFDEYQSKETARHVLRALKESARQGFWNGSLPPIGYRVVATEQRGAKVKKKLQIDPLHADTVRLIYRLALEGDGTSGPMGVKNITAYLNQHRIFTRD